MPPCQITRRPAPKGSQGVWVEDKAWGMSYALAALDADGASRSISRSGRANLDKAQEKSAIDGRTR